MELSSPEGPRRKFIETKEPDVGQVPVEQGRRHRALPNADAHGAREVAPKRRRPALGDERDGCGEGDPGLERIRELRQSRRPGTLAIAQATLPLPPRPDHRRVPTPGDVLATAALLRVLLERDLAPESVRLDRDAFMRLRTRGDVRPASEPQIRRVFALTRLAGLTRLDGCADRTKVSELVDRIAGVSEPDLLTREQVQDV